MKYIVFDVESDNLLDKATKIYCLSYYASNGKKGTVTGHAQIKDFFLTLPPDCILIGHNIIRYDIPLCEKILGIKIDLVRWDTLGLSWYLYPNRLEHGLESFGRDYNMPKIEVKDWVGADLSLYIKRCERDVEINRILWDAQYAYLQQLYLTGNEIRLLHYITFKLECAREQEEVRWKLDLEKCKASYQMLLKEKEPKIKILQEAMPENVTYKDIKKPEKMTKKDGSPSAAAIRWQGLLEDLGIEEPENGVITVESKVEPGNPASSDQLKSWLFSLGWKPISFKPSKSKVTGIVKNVPQINAGDRVCPSVQALFEKEPALEALDGLTIINHRLSILKGFMENMDQEGYVKAEIKGFTNTMRFQHTTVVNLPSVHKPYGKDIRGCLVAPPGDYLLCGSDMTSLEDSTKQHYMFFYDPEYVKEMRDTIFDPHVDIGVLAGMFTEEESLFYRWMDGKPVPEEKVAKKYLAMDEEQRKSAAKSLSKIRKDAKQVNFSAVYGAGPPKISSSTGMPLSKAQTLHNIYWKRNWAVKKIAKNTVHKTVNDQMWLFNPVSKFWYSLRFEKDKFSTLNQSTGVFCFDTQVRGIRNKGYKLCGQFHDEVVFPLKEADQEKVRKDLQEVIEETNETLKLNIKLGISLDFGKSYADIH